MGLELSIWIVPIIFNTTVHVLKLNMFRCFTELGNLALRGAGCRIDHSRDQQNTTGPFLIANSYPSIQLVTDNYHITCLMAFRRTLIIQLLPDTYGPESMASGKTTVHTVWGKSKGFPLKLTEATGNLEDKTGVDRESTMFPIVCY